MPSILCAPQAPSCQSNIDMVLKVSLRKADQSSKEIGNTVHVMIAIKYSYKLGKIIF